MFLQPLDELDPVHAGHVEVHDHHIVGLILERLDRNFGRWIRLRGIAVELERHLDRKPEGILIVDDEHPKH